MDKAVSVVYTTDDYNKFEKLKTNRFVSQSRVKKLIFSFKQKDIMNPILVNEKMQIIDGQGRYEARKALGLPIHYIVENGLDDSDCLFMNLYNTKWNNEDIGNSFAKSGNENYQRLLEVKEATGAPLSDIMRFAGIHRALVISGSNKETLLSPYVKGEVTFTEKDRDYVIMVFNRINEIRKALLFTPRPNIAFKTAVKVMSDFDGYDHKRMLSKCEQCRLNFIQPSNLTGMLKEFERIYNFRSSASSRLYFSDYMRNKGWNNPNNSYNDYGKKVKKDVSTLRKKKK